MFGHDLPMDGLPLCTIWIVTDNKYPSPISPQKKPPLICNILIAHEKDIKHFANILTTYVYVINLKSPIVPQTMSFVARFISWRCTVYLYIYICCCEVEGAFSIFGEQATGSHTAQCRLYVCPYNIYKLYTDTNRYSIWFNNTLSVCIYMYVSIHICMEYEQTCTHASFSLLFFMFCCSKGGYFWAFSFFLYKLNFFFITYNHVSFIIIITMYTPIIEYIEDLSQYKNL